MVAWLRIAVMLVVALAVVACLDYFGVVSVLGQRSADRADLAEIRSRELFWFAIFVAVMLTALLAAARRAKDRLRQAVVHPRH
jgi:hypothetical protein